MDGIRPPNRWTNVTVQWEELEAKTTSVAERKRAGGSKSRTYEKRRQTRATKMGKKGWMTEKELKRALPFSFSFFLLHEWNQSGVQLPGV